MATDHIAELLKSLELINGQGKAVAAPKSGEIKIRMKKGRVFAGSREAVVKSLSEKFTGATFAWE